ncbi:MAG: hypothetical protein V3R45_03710 [Candidatus Aminicenantaceae bacterium]
MIIQEVRRELKKHIDLEYKESVKRFFKKDQEISHYGVRTPIVRKTGGNGAPRLSQ